MDPFYSVSLPGYTHERSLYESEQDVDYVRDKQLYLLIEKQITKRVVHGARYFKSAGKNVLTHDVVNTWFGFFMT